MKATQDAQFPYLSRQRQSLISAAIAAGYNVARHGNNEVFILRGKTCRSLGLIIFEDGSIIRADADLHLCRKMTIKEAFKTLGL